MKQWHTYLVDIESIIIELDKMNLSKKEKLHLAHLIDSSLHHAIIDAVLSKLQEQDKRKFMMHLNEGDHDRIWAFLNSKVDNIEEQIKKVAEDLKKKLHKDIKEAR